MRSERINEILLRELEQAMAEFQACARDFGRVAKEIYNAAPWPDSGLALRLAGDRRRRAFHRLEDALARHHSFVMHGVAPADLTDPDVPFWNRSLDSQ